MKNFKIYKIVVVFFILISCEVKTTPTEEMILNNLEREIKKRNFINDLLDSLGTFTYEGKAFLISNKLDSFYIVYNNSNKVILLNKELKFVNSFLKEGEGPNEHIGVKRLFFTSNSSYSTFDHSQQLFRLFGKNDSMLVFNKFERERWVDDIVQLTDSIYLFSENFQDKYNFVVKNLINNKTLKEYNIVNLLNLISSNFEISSLPYDKGLIFEGYFSFGSGNNIVYTCNKAGLFFVFNKSGDFLFASRTIDKLPIPKFVKVEVSSGYFLHSVIPDLRGNKSRAINDDFVFILSNLLLPSYLDKRPIDVYSSNTGEYQFSFFIPNLLDGQVSDEISIWQNNLYVLYENSTIVEYKLKVENFKEFNF